MEGRGFSPVPAYTSQVVSETVEAEGHLIDSGNFQSILTTVVEHGSEYEILRFDVGRPRTPAHVAFGGGGVHFCLGASLARLELAILLEEIQRAGLEIELAGTPHYVRSNFVNGIESLPVRVRRS